MGLGAQAWGKLGADQNAAALDHKPAFERRGLVAAGDRCRSGVHLPKLADFVQPSLQSVAPERSGAALNLRGG